MSVATLILGESGSGKTAALRNMEPSKTLLIQAIHKPLPFKNDAWKPFDAAARTGNIITTDKAADILVIMQNTKRKVIVVDDFQYVLANELMRRYGERGYDKFSEIGYNGWHLCTIAGQLAPDVRVYILAHEHMDENGRIKIKTPGKLLDTHSVEGMFTTVMRAVVRDREHLFTTRNSGTDTVKTPIGLFDDEVIPNDLQAVDEAICAYYGIETKEQK